MGCYNTTGFVSGLSVRCSDPIVAIPCVIVNRGKYSPTNYYTTSQLKPISLPLYGKYDDYGSIEDIEDTPSARAWKLSICDDIEGCMKIFERSNEDCTKLSKILKNEKDFLYEHNYDKIKDGLLKALRPDDDICLIIEHRKVYEELSKWKDLTGRRENFFKDYVSFHRLLLKRDCGGLENILSDMSFSPFGLFLTLEEFKDEVPVEIKEVVEESKRLFEKWKNTTADNFFFGWQYGFQIYNNDYMNKETIFDIEGIAEAFSDFSKFDHRIMTLNVGYRVPSCNCGSQNDFNDNIIKFHNFLSDFYENNLKDEYDEDEEWEDPNE